MKIYLIGTGCGTGKNITVQAADILKRADAIIGAPRLLEGLGVDLEGRKFPAVLADEIIKIITDLYKDVIVEKHAATEGEAIIVVAYSGDSGFYSGCRSLLPKLSERGLEAEVLPGISSIQMLASRLKRPWQDWNLFSAHGTECSAVSAVMQGKPAFFLTGGNLVPKKLCRELAEAGLGDLDVVIAERLSYDDEKITEGRASDFIDSDFESLAVMLVENPDTAPKRTSGFPDEAFVRGKVPMTKQEIRSVILSKLGIREGELVWDVGAGTGSVSVEMALAASGGSVYAVECVPEGCELIENNRRRFGAWNLRVVEGKAPEALEALPAPDAVFIGGSRGQMKPILELIKAKNHRARICISAIAIESLGEASTELARLGYDVSISHVSFSNDKAVGRLHMMMGGNPIFIVMGTPAEDAE